MSGGGPGADDDGIAEGLGTARGGGSLRAMPRPRPPRPPPRAPRPPLPRSIFHGAKPIIIEWMWWGGQKSTTWIKTGLS